MSETAETIPDHIWRQYDIRGVAGEDLSEETAHLLGRAFGSLIARSGGDSIVVAHDARLTSPAYARAAARGAAEAGLEVSYAGLGSTPQMYFTVVTRELDGGLMVTASHNPPEYNGFKMRDRERSWFGDDIQRVKKLVMEQDFESSDGDVVDIDASVDYVRHLAGNVGIRPMKVVVDAGNGSAGPVAVQTLEALGCTVIPLFVEPDGHFPNHVPDPTVPANMRSLIEKVGREGADLGIAFDGDGDRVALVSASGDLIFGDRMLYVVASHHLPDHPGPVVFDVKCSMALEERVRELGGTPVMWKTGYPLIQARMRETGAQIAGEMSGHIYFDDRYIGVDDGLYAALRVMEIMTETGRDLDQLMAGMPKLPSSPELRLHCPESEKFGVLGGITDALARRFETIDVDGIRFKTDDGWGLLRVSNTEPAIVCRIEARSEDGLGRLAGIVLESLSGTPVDVEPLREYVVG